MAALGREPSSAPRLCAAHALRRPLTSTTDVRIRTQLTSDSTREGDRLANKPPVLDDSAEGTHQVGLLQRALANSRSSAYSTMNVTSCWWRRAGSATTSIAVISPSTMVKMYAERS